jgi:polysaccharide chain length determinant protein (PEP-CTERM system associated)
MYDLALLIQKYGRMVLRYRWIGLAVAVLFCAVGWIVVLLLPNQYLVSTTVFVDTRSLLKPLLHGLTIDAGASQEDVARMVHRMLLVRENLATVARQTGLDSNATTPREFEQLLATLRTQIRITPGQAASTFELSYVNTEPKLAMEVVEALLQMFVERARGEKRDDALTSRQFLSREIAVYESRLRDAEQRLEEFKRSHSELMQDAGYFAQLETLRTEASANALKLKEAESRRNQIKRDVEEMADLLDVPLFVEGADGSAQPHPLDARIGALQERLDELLTKYTERHPTIVYTQRVLDQLIEKKNRSLVARASSDPLGAGISQRTMANPLYGGLRVALAGAQSEVAALSTRQQEYGRRQQQLRKQRDAAFQAEAQLKDLNRDYEIQKKNYEELVRRREALEITDKVRETAAEFKFRLVEPPREPLLPVGPNRPVFNALVLAMGLGAGVGVAWLLAQLRATVYTKQDLTELTQLPVFGTVSLVQDKKALLARRINSMAFVSILLVLGAAFGAVTGIDGNDVKEHFQRTASSS